MNIVDPDEEICERPSTVDTVVIDQSRQDRYDFVELVHRQCFHDVVQNADCPNLVSIVTERSENYLYDTMEVHDHIPGI